MVKVLMAENGTECTYKIQRCAHFYACLCAFASDEKLAKEFKFALDADMEGEFSLPTIFMASRHTALYAHDIVAWRVIMWLDVSDFLSCTINLLVI